MSSGSDSVKVAVRVRPFNQREKNANSKCMISMKDSSTTITNPETGDSKTFSFDHSYWSHDNYVESEDGVFTQKDKLSTYADQWQVFKDLGQGVLDNAWQGYNAALFAYGQTGSGKSYSMIGYNHNKGIVPITCEELFKAIDENDNKEKQLQVSFSMLEIYNEQVRDLLVKSKQQPTGGLKVRQSPTSGFYVEGLKQVPVRTYKEIEKLMEQGTVNRTTASTNMNATSSRSHMVITIQFAQVFLNEVGQSNTRSSDINLVDLAGSERADSTGATGDRLKEGSAINQSLSTLGNVISALADVAMGKKKVLVPYRDSVLTKLLQSALGGNSRTIMIAALSPADINYDETLSTLRYADRAKKIQNKAMINESPTDRLIRELKEENAKLMTMLQNQGGKGSIAMTEDVNRMLEENQAKMRNMNLSWEQRLDEARREWEQQFHTEQHDWEQAPYFTNVNEDPQLSGIITHSFHKGNAVMGRTGSVGVTLELRGLGIQEKHAILNNNGSAITLEPGCKTAQIFINGHKVKDKLQLHHLDRVKFGSRCLFLYIGFPSERTSRDAIQKYNFDYFITELAEHEGVTVDVATPRTPDAENDNSAARIFQEYTDLVPKIAEANAIGEELKKGVRFEVEIKSLSCHDMSGKCSGKEMLVRVTNVKTKKVWIWSKAKFLNRKDHMDEMYGRFLDSQNIAVKRDGDPFWDPVEDIFIGSCHVWLQSLVYGVEIDEHFTLHNYHGKEEAVIQVCMLPCDSSGQVLTDNEIVEPMELLGQSLNFQLMIPECMGVRWTMDDHSRGIYCRLKLHGQVDFKSKTVCGKSYADLGLTKQLSFKKVTDALLRYFQNESMVVELWGTQVSEDKETHKPSLTLSAADTRRAEASSAADTRRAEASSAADTRQAEENEVEQLQEESDSLKKENFKLRQDLEKYKQALKLTKAKKSNVSDNNNSGGTLGLDVELAKALQVFFKDIRNIQQQVKNMKDYASSVQKESKENGNLKNALGKTEKQLETMDTGLMDCIQSLRKSVSNTIKKSKEPNH